MKTAIEKIKFESSSSDAVYEVTRWTDGSLSCNCRGWTFKKGDAPRSCKHTRSIDQLAEKCVPAEAPSAQSTSERHSARRGGQGLSRLPLHRASHCSTTHHNDARCSFNTPAFFKPMLAQSTERQAYETLMADKRFIAEPKFDGQRALVFIDNHKAVACFSRLGNDLLKTKANGAAWIGEIDWPIKQGVIDAELCSESGTCRAASDAEHARSTAGLELGLIIFDLLELNGENLKGQPWNQRRGKLELVFEGFKHDSIQITPYSTDAKALWKKWVEEMGGEGIMLKKTTSIYRPGNRSWDWLKLKFEVTVDVVVTGITEKATYNGQSYKNFEAALTYGYYDPRADKFVTVGQGGLGPMLGAKTELKNHIGKVVEMRCAGVMSSGALRNGFFVRWRTDKAPKDCTMPGLN